MSCNGCRVLRKGCSDSCILRSSLQCIDSPDAQGHATVFVAKFFGRAGMIGLISAVDESQRPAVFQSLLYEACGRTVNPVYGAVGLLWSGNWAICQAAVETVLKGGSLKPLPSVLGGGAASPPPSLPICIPSDGSFLLADASAALKRPALQRDSVHSEEPFCKQRIKKRRKASLESDEQSQVVAGLGDAAAAAAASNSAPSQATEARHNQCHHNDASDKSSSSPIAIATQRLLPKKESHLVVAPVPRRIKPLILPPSQSSTIADAKPPSLTQDQRRTAADQPDAAAVAATAATGLCHSSNADEEERLLNLNLSLALEDASKKPRGIVMGSRVWSPQCSLSEGSVTTSLDSVAAAAAEAAASEFSTIRSSCAREAGHGEKLLLLKLL